MKHRSLLIYWICLPFVFSGCLPSDSHEKVFQSIDREVKAHFSAYQNLQEIVRQIGPRMTGSENGRRAEQFAYDLFKRYGYDDAVFDEFKISAWERGDISLEVAAAPGEAPKKIKAASFAYSPEEAFAAGKIADLENGTREDFDHAGDLKDKVVLISLGVADPNKKNLRGIEKIELSAKKGAKAVIFFPTKKKDMLITGSVSRDREVIAVPVLCVTNDDAALLKEKIKTGRVLTARIEMHNRAKKTTARNITAALEGSRRPNERILLTAHLDSWDLATGAIDNGTGAFTVLEIARAFKALGIKPKRTIQFVLFMGEEQGMVGSRAFVEHLKEKNKLDEIKYLVNLDMEGDPLGFNAMGRKGAEDFIKKNGEWIRRLDGDFQNNVKDVVGINGDQETFLLEGIPAIAVNGAFDESIYFYFHSDKDQLEFVNQKALLNNSRFVAMMVSALAEADRLPAGKLDENGTKEFLLHAGLKEELAARGHWKWN